MIRPELAARILRWREPLAALALAGFGLWLMALGGLVLRPLGLMLLCLAGGWGLTAMRRLRFARSVEAPGLVEVDEGQVGYLGPTFGGYVALADLVEIRMIELYGKRHWRLRQADGQALLIPVAASGAEALFDAFATLPGADMARLAAALDAPPGIAPLWSRRLARPAYHKTS